MLAVALATLLPLVQVTSDACLNCHQDAGVDSHLYAINYIVRPQLRAPSMPSGFGGTVASDFLVNGRVECASCHATHEQETDNKFRLRIESADNPTAMCIACHVLDR